MVKKVMLASSTDEVELNRFHVSSSSRHKKPQFPLFLRYFGDIETLLVILTILIFGYLVLVTDVGLITCESRSGFTALHSL